LVNEFGGSGECGDKDVMKLGKQRAQSPRGDWTVESERGMLAQKAEARIVLGVQVGIRRVTRFIGTARLENPQIRCPQSRSDD
jgi:hypothetical protein